MKDFSKAVSILEKVGFKLLTVGKSFDTFSKNNEDDSVTFLDIDKKDGSFSIFTKFEDSIIVYGVPVDVAIAIVEYSKELGI